MLSTEEQTEHNQREPECLYLWENRLEIWEELQRNNKRSPLFISITLRKEEKRSEHECLDSLSEPKSRNSVKPARPDLRRILKTQGIKTKNIAENLELRDLQPRESRCASGKERVTSTPAASLRLRTSQSPETRRLGRPRRERGAR